EAQPPQYGRTEADIRELETGHGGNAYGAAQNAAQVCIYYPTNPATSTAGNVGDPVQVSVRVDYHWLNYLVSKLSIATTPITGQATMRLERQAKAGALSVPGRKTCYQ